MINVNLVTGLFSEDQDKDSADKLFILIEYYLCLSVKLKTRIETIQNFTVMIQGYLLSCGIDRDIFRFLALFH